jgi:hypothetical protein
MPAIPVPDLIRCAILAAIVVIVWCTVYDRWSADSWGVPIEYGTTPDRADVKAVLAAFRSASTGNVAVPFVFHSVPQLGAPYVANWNDYPATEDFLFSLAGILGKVFGLFAASNLLILILHVLAALAFYFAARRFKCDWKWAFTGALFFAFAPFAFSHGLHHVVITAYWHIPLGILVAFWAANGRGLRIGTPLYWMAIGVAVIFGWENVYYNCMFIQIVGIALIIQWLRHGLRAAIPPFTIGCVALGATVLMFLKTFLYNVVHGHNAGAIVRNYAQMEYYALKLVDCFIPFPTHKIPAFAELGRSFYSMTILPAEIPPACYFGVVGIAAFLWLAVVTVRNAVARDRRRIPFEAVLTLWIFFFAMVGGINNMVGVVGFQMFRSTTRYSIVIFALALLFGARRISLLSKRWPSPWPVVAPIAFAVIGLWEILPPFAGENIAAVQANVSSDRTFAQEMESRLPKGGMVFQLPVIDYPENPVPGVSAYDHFRPFFYTKDLRYSFGSDKGRIDTAWQRVVAAMQPAQQVAALESYGFAGIYVNRAGYQDHGESMRQKYADAGRSEVIDSPGQDLFCVVLHPSPNPVLPPPGPLFAKGWYAEQDNAAGTQRDRLASGNVVTLMLNNPTAAPQDKYATFFLATLAPRIVTVQGAGAFQSWHVDQQHPAQVQGLHFTLQPGDNWITFTTDAPASPQQMGPVTFDVVNFVLSDTP